MKNYYEKFKNHYIALKNQEIISYCRIFEYAIVKYYRIKKIYNLVDSLEKASHNWFELKRENKNKKNDFLYRTDICLELLKISLLFDYFNMRATANVTNKTDSSLDFNEDFFNILSTYLQPNANTDSIVTNSKDLAIIIKKYHRYKTGAFNLTKYDKKIISYLDSISINLMTIIENYKVRKIDINSMKKNISKFNRIQNKFNKIKNASISSQDIEEAFNAIFAKSFTFELIASMEDETKKNIYDHSTLKKLEAHNYRCFITPISRELFSENHARSDTYDNFFKSNYKKSKNIIYMENSIDEIFKLFSNLEDGINEFRKIKKALDKNL